MESLHRPAAAAANQQQPLGASDDNLGERQTLVTGTLVYGFGEVLNRSLPFLLLPLLTSYLTPADFGVASLLAALSAFLAPVISLGLGAALAPVYFDDQTDRYKGLLVGTAVGILLLNGVVMVALVGVARSWLSQLSFDSAAYGRLVVLTAIGTAFTSLAVPFRQFLQFEKRARAYVSLSAASTILTVGLTIALVAWIGRGLSGFIEASSLGQVATCAIFAIFVLRRLRLRLDRKRGLQLLRIGLPLVPAFGSLFLLQHGTKYLLQQVRGVEDVGIYTVGLNIGLVISVLVTAFQGAWVPFFMRFANRPEAAKVELGRVTTYFVLVFGSVSLALFAVARLVVMIMTQPAFHDAWRVVGISGMTQVLNGIFIVLLPGMYFAKELRFIGILQLGAAAASLAFGLVLIPLFGVMGAAVAMLLGYATLDVLLFTFNRWRRYVDVRYEWQRLATFSVVYVAVAGALLVDRKWTVTQETALTALVSAGVALLLWMQLNASERSASRVWLQQQFVRR